MPFGYAPGMTLGQLIQELRRSDSDKVVEFDFCQLVPSDLRSYRGYYEDLAIGWAEGQRTAGDLLEQCEKVLGTTMHGYKGGAYEITKDTPLWVSNWGSASGTIIKAVDRPDSYTLVLVTERYE